MMKNQTIPVNEALINAIAPMGLEFKRNSLVVGENMGKVYGVIRYAQKLDYGWLAKITNLPSTVVTIGIKPIDNGLLVNALSKAILQKNSEAQSTKEPKEKARALKAAEDAETIMLQIDRDGETVAEMNITIMPIAKEEKFFSKLARKIESVVYSMQGGKARSLANLQKQGLQHISPTFPAIDQIETILNRIVPMSTIVGGFPFASSGYSDGTGYYVAKDHSGGLVILDLWKRGNDRTNSNLVIMGVPGVGKSTSVKHLIIAEYMIGTKVIIVDPETEYKDLCLNLNGDWINAGGSQKGRLNPLQVRPAPKDDDDDESLNELAVHFKTLDVFFSLYLPSLTDRYKAILKQALVELYANFNITWETDIKTLRADQFPTFTDLFHLLQQKKEKEFEELMLLLHDITFGADSFLWNGHSTIETSSRIVCLDTHRLQNTSENVKRTQYFNILSWAWEQMSQNRDQKVILVCDEAYLMIDPKVPESLGFLRNVAKRARKYEAALWVISHSVVDFLAEQVKVYGQALMDSPALKLIMGTDGQNLKETKALYNLTDAEVELLESKRRAHGLLMVGSKRMHVKFEISDYKFQYMGKAGGR